MSKIQDALMSEEEKRARKLESQRRVLCPEGEFVFVHKNCLDDAMLLLEKNHLIVYPGQVEEFSVESVLTTNNIDTLGICDSCRQHIDNPSSSYYRLWVLTKDDYQKNVEYRKSYDAKKDALKKKSERHQKWQQIEYKTPIRFLPITRFIRKLAYMFFK